MNLPHLGPPQALDSSMVYLLTLNGDDTDLGSVSLAGLFTGSESFSARIWPGGNLPTLVDLTAGVAWSDYTIALLELTVTSTDLVGLEPQAYRIEILVNPGSENAKAFNGWIDLVDGGDVTGVAPKTLNTLRDMQGIIPWIAEVLSDDDLAGFLRQRGLAYDRMSEWAMARAEMAFDNQIPRHGAINPSSPVVPTTGVDAGPFYGRSIYPNTSRRDQLATIQTKIDADLWIHDAWLVRVAARMSIYYVLNGSIGQRDKTPYQLVADEQYRLAIWEAYPQIFRFPADDDGIIVEL